MVVEAGEAVGDRQTLDAAVEAGVLDRHRGQRRQGAGELELRLGEAAHAALLDELEAADDPLLGEKRHVEAALLLPVLHGGALAGRELRVVDGRLDDATLAQHLVEHGLLFGCRRRPYPALVAGVRNAGPEGLGNGQTVGGAILVDAALPHVERAGDALGDGGEDLFEHQARRDRRDDLGGDGKAARHPCPSSRTYRHP